MWQAGAAMAAVSTWPRPRRAAECRDANSRRIPLREVTKAQRRPSEAVGVTVRQMYADTSEIELNSSLRLCCLKTHHCW